MNNTQLFVIIFNNNIRKKTYFALNGKNLILKNIPHFYSPLYIICMSIVLIKS